MQKTNENEDLRVRRTRKMLQEALMALTVEKGFQAVTVRDITERAMVNRSTFYRHYLDKYALLQEYIDELYNMTSDDTFVTERVGEDNVERPSRLITLLEHIQRYADFFRVMLGQDGDQIFTLGFRQNIEKRFRHLLTLPNAVMKSTDLPLDMRLMYVSCAGIGLILWWLENDQPCSVEQLARWMSQLSMSNVGIEFRPPELSK